jgi:hypothetical protein
LQTQLEDLESRSNHSTDVSMPKEFYQYKLMNHPSREYIVPVESIPGNGVQSWCSNNHYLCHYHHYVEWTHEYHTRVELVSLTGNCRIADLIYTWTGIPVWALDPKCISLAVTICDHFLAFATRELYVESMLNISHSN